MTKTISVRRVAAAALAAALLAPAAVAWAQTGECFTATASVTSPKQSGSAPITIQIDKFVTDADRDRIMNVIKQHDPDATREALAAMPDVGYIELGAKRTPVKYAYARPSGGGRLITVVTAQPILFLGGAAPDAKPKKGFDLALALLVLSGDDTGDGELAPAAKVKIDAQGAIVTEDYGSEVVRLAGIAKAR